MSMAFKVQGGKVVRTIKRPSRALVSAFLEMPTSILSDCQDRMNAMRPELKAVLPGKHFAGPAFTVEEI